MLWNGVDIILIILLVVVTMIETCRAQEGFDLALYDTIGVVLTVTAANKLHPSLAAATGWTPLTAYILIFLGLLAASFIIGYLAHHQTMFTLDTFDSVMGFLCGFITAWAIGHGFLRILLLYDPQGTGISLQVTSWLSDQLLNFSLFHRASQSMHQLGNY